MKRKKQRKQELLDKRRSIPERIFFIASFLVLLFWSIALISMLCWAVISSLKTNMEYVNDPLGLPEVLQFNNIKIAMEKLSHNGVGFFGMLYNSLWQTVGISLIGTTTVCVTGYVFAQYEFRGKGLLFSIVVFVMIIPIYGSFSATYKLIYDLGLNDSYAYLITAFGGFNSNMLLTYGYFKGIPKDMREAVYMDGGSDYVAFFKVYFPLARNIFIAIFLLSFIANWNNYESPILYFDKMPTLASGLYYFQQEIQYVANNPAYFAGALMVMLPVVIIFVFCSDKIMGQLYSGSVKG